MIIVKREKAQKSIRQYQDAIQNEQADNLLTGNDFAGQDSNKCNAGAGWVRQETTRY